MGKDFCSVIFVSEKFDRAVFGRIRKVRAKVEVLDLDLNPVAFDWTPNGDITADYVEGSGSVEQNTDRTILRTASLTMYNKEGRYLADPQGPVWFDKLWRLSYGLVTDYDNRGREVVEWCPLGVFTIHSPESSAGETTARNVSLTLLDRSYRLTDPHLFTASTLPSYTVGPNTLRGYARNTRKTEVMRDLAVRMGWPADQLLIEDSAALTATAIPITVGDDPLEKFREVVSSMSRISYADPNGFLVVRPRPAANARNVVARYLEDQDLTLGMSSSWEFENFRNAVLVQGGAGDTPTFVAYMEDTRDGSPTNVNRIGRRLFRHNEGQPDPLIGSQVEADTKALQLLERELSYTQAVSWPQITDPRLEVYDVLELYEPTLGVSGFFSLRSYTCPLGYSDQPANGAVNRRVDL